MTEMAKLIIVRLITVGLAFGIVSVPIAAGRAQTEAARPNFSGTWVFDPDATDAASSPIRNGTNIFGQSFVAHHDAKTLKLDITLAPNIPIVTASYALDGTETKNVSPAPMPGMDPIVVTAIAKWVGKMLTVESRSQQPAANASGQTMMIDVISTRTFSLDSAGRLVIDRDGTPKQVVPSTRSVYSKKQ
jgi:hypothetical protein